jgi:hypothetical protein
MFYDDNYHPTDQNDYDIETSSFSASTSGGDSEYKRIRKIREDFKKSDPGYSKINRSTKGKSKIEIYRTSSIPGATIRNAVTGMYEHGKLFGSKDEDHFFSVALATGQTGQDTPMLFYDSPQQYERHFDVTVSQETKARWAHRTLAARLRNDKD